VNRIVLLGDGVPNNEAPMLNLAQAAGQSGVAVTTLGPRARLQRDADEPRSRSTRAGIPLRARLGAVASVFKEEV
jgi:hypothetical protein